MKSLLFYLVQVMVASGILYGYYHLALRNKKFHHYNRFYLLAAFVISIIVPFFNIPVYFTSTDTASSFILHTLTSFSSPGPQEVVVPIIYIVPEKTNWFTWQNLAYLFYIVIAFIVLIRILFSLKKIRHIIRNNPVEKLEDIHFVNTDEPGTPFSFFHWMFWNRRIELQSEKGEQIFRHELFHIQEKHSHDIIFMEIMMVVFWINPFFHLIKKEVKAIHEFLADQFAIKENQHWEYAELLLMQALSTRQHLVNPFFHHQIKRRIAMITSSTKSGQQYLRKLMVLPIAAIVFALFAFAYKTKENSIRPELSYPKSIITDTVQLEKISHGPNNAYVKSYRMSNLQNEEKIAPLLKKGVTFFGFPDTNKAIKNGILIIIDGKERPDIKTLKEIDNSIMPNQIESVYVLKDSVADSKYGEKGKNGVIEIITKPKNENRGDQLPGINSDDTTKPGNPGNKIYDKVEIEPSFPGGKEKWKQYLEKNLDASLPVKKKSPGGIYTVIIRFVVDEKGYIHDIKALTNHGYGMEDEAIRIISKGPKWIPAIQNGLAVKAYKKQPITFVVTAPSTTKTEENTRQNIIRSVPEITIQDLVELNIRKLAGIADNIKNIQFNIMKEEWIDNKLANLHQIHVSGFELNASAKEFLKNVQTGTLISFDDIYIIRPGAEVREKIPSLIFKIISLSRNETTEKSIDIKTPLISSDITFPVENATLQMPYGKNEIRPGVIYDSPGITLCTAKGSLVRSMQKGIIAAVTKFDKTTVIIIRENNYFTTYSGLGNVKVIKGQKVNKGDLLGEVAADEKKNYLMDFIVMNNTNTVDPIHWLKNQ